MPRIILDPSLTICQSSEDVNTFYKLSKMSRAKTSVSKPYVHSDTDRGFAPTVGDLASLQASSNAAYVSLIQRHLNEENIDLNQNSRLSAALYDYGTRDILTLLFLRKHRDQEDDVSVSELAQALGGDTSSKDYMRSYQAIRRKFEILEQAGLIEREVQMNTKARHVSLTPEAEALLKSFYEEQSKLVLEVASKLSSDGD